MTQSQDGEGKPRKRRRNRRRKRNGRRLRKGDVIKILACATEDDTYIHWTLERGVKYEIRHEPGQVPDVVTEVDTDPMGDAI